MSKRTKVLATLLGVYGLITVANPGQANAAARVGSRCPRVGAVSVDGRLPVKCVQMSTETRWAADPSRRSPRTGASVPARPTAPASTVPPALGRADGCIVGKWALSGDNLTTLMNTIAAGTNVASWTGEMDFLFEPGGVARNTSSIQGTVASPGLQVTANGIAIADYRFDGRHLRLVSSPTSPAFFQLEIAMNGRPLPIDPRGPSGTMTVAARCSASQLAIDFPNPALPSGIMTYNMVKVP